MKKNAILVNVARGAVVDEAAVAEAIRNGRLGGFGCDVYSTEPYPVGHPYESLAGCSNVILTPHMAWGAYEARERCLAEICENIKVFFEGGVRNRVDL
jgi:glycerate dehydrogenase